MIAPAARRHPCPYRPRHPVFAFLPRSDNISPSIRIGDAKYFTLVRGQRLPPAKFSVIAEHVWLLEKTGVLTTFLVFGNDRQVPSLWLERYGHLVGDVAFYYLTDEGELELLTEKTNQ